ncbi:hypothetical protein VTI74DRAFT_2743 [Chaetomium olivicolor]
MDGNSGQRTPSEPPIYSASSSRHHQSLHEQSQQMRLFAGAQGERFRPAPFTMSPSWAARGMGGPRGYGGYEATSSTGFPTKMMPQRAMSYHCSTTDYGQPDTRQPQRFGGTYTPAMMYRMHNMGRQNGAAVYDTSQQFSSRQAAGLPMMSTDVTASYFSSEPTNVAATSALHAQTTFSNAPLPGLHGYHTSSMVAMGGLTSQTSPAYPSTAGLDEAYASYQSVLKEIYQSIRSGVLATASESLLSVSGWLLSHVVELGLASDDQNLYGERIELWNGFNHACGHRA